MRRFFALAAAIAVSGLASGTAWAQAERPAVQKGVQYLKSKVATMKVGETGIAALAMIKAEVAKDDPAIFACVQKFSTCFTGTLEKPTYTPETRGGPDLYEAAVVLLALVSIDEIGYKPQINACAQFLIGRQYPNGSWDYSDRTAGDTSMTQYALLGLWEAENVGIIVPPHIWDKAASWFIGAQGGNGAWNYHPDQGGQWPETISMTAAGVGSLMICQKQLARHRKGQDLINPLMTPISVDGQAAETRYKVETPAAAITSSINRGVAWLVGHFQVNKDPIMGQSPYYALYGIERLAGLGGKETLGGIDWYGKGLSYVMSTQGASGSWDAQHDQVPNTCWAVLFSTKATQIMMNKIQIRRLAGGKLRTGDGLPLDLNNAVMGADGQLTVKPMGGAIEAMLAVLEDPNTKDAASALAGLVKQYQTQGPKVLRPLKDRFRKLLRDSDPNIRVVAAWGLGRTTDLDVAPVLIKALLDEDDKVVDEARTGLQVLSRKLDGFGPPSKASAAERLAAAKRWQAWFQSVKPPDLDAPDDLLPAAAPAANAAAANAAGQ
ncbi:MAG: lyase HEAT-like repeat protein [Planctomycetota bacterium]|nr:lyase HEAT-like repeat protein [Planctomycetota bacterium]